MTGASLGFLWYNAHPAEIFMGDVGSLSLGGAMGVVAVLIKQEILLVFIGGVYILEGMSVILQVGSYKLRGKRIFKMAPLHHHFEALGWQESKIISAVLDRRTRHGAVRLDDVETAMRHELNGRTVLVVGMGKSGPCRDRAAPQQGANVLATDEKQVQPLSVPCCRKSKIHSSAST